MSARVLFSVEGTVARSADYSRPAVCSGTALAPAITAVFSLVDSSLLLLKRPSRGGCFPRVWRFPPWVSGVLQLTYAACFARAGVYLASMSSKSSQYCYHQISENEGEFTSLIVHRSHLTQPLLQVFSCSSKLNSETRHSTNANKPSTKPTSRARKRDSFPHGVSDVPNLLFVGSRSIAAHRLIITLAGLARCFDPRFRAQGCTDAFDHEVPRGEEQDVVVVVR